MNSIHSRKEPNDELITVVIRLHDIIKRYELLVEYLITTKDTSIQESTLRDAIIIHGWNISKISRVLGISRTTIVNRIKEFNIVRPDETPIY